jgi:hypothetical protein
MYSSNKQRIVIAIVMVAAFAVMITGCGQDKPALQDNQISITGSGNIVSQEMSVSGFDQVVAGLFFNLVIRQGEDFAVVIYADDNFVDYIQVEKEGTTLTFDLKPGYAYNITGTTMKAEVTMPFLARLVLNGSSHAELDGFQNVGPFKAELTGSSSLTGRLEGDRASFNVYGNAAVQLAGSAKSLFVDACGNSVVDLSAFRVKDGSAQASCASTVTVNGDVRLDSEVTQNGTWPKAIILFTLSRLIKRRASSKYFPTSLL